MTNFVLFPSEMKNLKRLILILVALSFIAGVCIAHAQQQEDPLLNDVRYWQQVKNTLLQEQRANAMQAEMLKKRQVEIQNAVKAIDGKIRELQSQKGTQPAPVTQPSESTMP